LLALQLLDVLGVHENFGRLNERAFDEVEVVVAGELFQKPEEGLFVLVVALGRNVVVLEVALSVEVDLASLQLTVLDISLVSNQDDGDVFTNLGQVLVPLGDVLVGLTRSEVEHDDGAVGINVVALAEIAEFLLSSSIPDDEADLTTVGREVDAGDIGALGGNVRLLELTSDVTLNECGLADAAISDNDELEGSDGF